MTNSVTLIGNVGKDPEIRQTKAGKSVASFSVATTEKWNDVETTQWHNIVCFGGTTKIAERISKGDKVVVLGKIQYRKTPEGKYFTDILAQQLFIGDRAPQQQHMGGMDF